MKNKRVTKKEGMKKKKGMGIYVSVFVLDKTACAPVTRLFLYFVLFFFFLVF